jgi:hypothetical protein
MGQGYGDLEEFDHDRFLDSIFKDKVYDKTGKILTPSNDLSVDNTNKAESVIEIPNINPVSDIAKLESPTSNADKVLRTFETEKQTTPPQTSELSPTKSDDDQKFDDRLNHFTEEKRESKTKMNEPRPKGGLFKKIFKDGKDKKDTDDSGQSILDKLDTKKEMNKKENRNKNKSKSERENQKDDEVVYLTDDDINDLIK